MVRHCRLRSYVTDGTLAVIVIVGGIMPAFVMSQTNFNTRPIWGTGRGRQLGKSCLDFCQLFPACNNGKCFMDHSTCTVICACEEGYTGRWCKQRDDQLLKEEEKVNNSTGGARNPSLGIPWGNQPGPVLSGTTKRPLMILGMFNRRPGNDDKKPPLIFSSITSGIPSMKSKPVDDDAMGGNTSTVSPVTDSIAKPIGDQFVSPNETTMADILKPMADGDDEGVTGRTIGDSTMESTTITLTTQVLTNTGLGDAPDPSKSPGILGTSSGNDSITTVSPLTVCERECHVGRCLLYRGEYKCVQKSLPSLVPSSSNDTVLDKSECSKGFMCNHGICDQEQLKMGRIKCVCDEGWIGTLCEHSCKLDCGKNSHSITTVSPLTVCEKECHVGRCLLYRGEYKCVQESLPVPSSSNDTVLDKSECGKGFNCTHGICDQEQLKKGRFKCVCDEGWIGTLCEHSCKLDCGQHGQCVHLTQNKTSMGCLCSAGYFGDRCQTYDPMLKEVEDSPVHLYVIGFTVGFLVLFVLVISLITYCMWRRRLVFIMKIVHYFQHYEEDDGQIYDAFISYKSSKEDEHFVLSKLYPKLEVELGFKLCMHFRDFTPGEAIANNIITAIERSRRTIMVLSPNYINSEWCRMEYQKAQHEMLKMRHKIIPIVLDDISKYKTIDKNLKTILSTVTYIEWPGEEDSKKLEKFWKKIALSLPKKRAVEQGRSSSGESTTSTMSDDIDLGKVISEEPPCTTTSADDKVAPASPSIYSISNNDDINRQSMSSPQKVRSDSRLQKMKDVLKLKINNNNNRALCREMSVDSNTLTPISATPSPGLFGGKDSTPLLSRRLLDVKQMNNKCVNKSYTWSHRNHGKSRSHCQAQSFNERDHVRPCLDVIPHSAVTPSPATPDLPDVCRTSGYFNIMCEEATFAENKLTGTPTCQTCVHRREDVDVNATVDSRVQQPNIGPEDRSSYNSFTNCKQIQNVGNRLGDDVNIGNNIDNLPVLNIRVDSSCPTCVYNYTEDGQSDDVTNLSVTSHMMSQVASNCPTCVLKCNVDNINQRVIQNTSDFKTVNISARKRIASVSKEQNCEAANKISNIEQSENLNVMDNRYAPNFHVNSAFVEHDDNTMPIPPVRVKKLHRLNSRDNLSEGTTFNTPEI